ncbi:hypothetical protein ACH4F9_07555 [Streptomyces longisporoflavus]|uniref:Transposase n=1 Tax=Streptomyces longisporoflavus TaxID=28044 RepID=A0ABW7QKU4_9ACTN
MSSPSTSPTCRGYDRAARLPDDGEVLGLAVWREHADSSTPRPRCGTGSTACPPTCADAGAPVVLSGNLLAHAHQGLSATARERLKRLSAGWSCEAAHEEHGHGEVEGIEGLRTRSRAPKHSPNATHVEVVGKIAYLRQSYHFGPEKIAMYLKRYHDVMISKSGVWRILDRLDMGQLPASQRYKRHDCRWKRYEKQLPGHRVQIDVKFIEPLASMPRGTPRPPQQVLPVHRDRRLHAPARSADLPTAQPGHRHPIPRLRHPAPAIPGRGDPDGQRAEFQSAFHWHTLDKGIAHTYIKPRTTRLNGKVERLHRIDAEEFYRPLEGVIIDDADVFNDKLVGGLIQLPSPPRRPRRPDSLRTPQAEDRAPGVIDDLQSHTDKH